MRMKPATKHKVITLTIAYSIAIPIAVVLTGYLFNWW